jgi:UDP-N-acetylglucosamine 2-epimerase
MTQWALVRRRALTTLPLVTIVLGTRPEAIKLAPVIQAFQRADDFATRVVLTGQHREMVSQVMELFGITADHDLALMAPKQTPGSAAKQTSIAAFFGGAKPPPAARLPR